jgi:hypothetical protein
MKKLLISLVALSIAIMFLTSGDARKRPGKANPCIRSCQVEFSKCMRLAKKSPKAERNAKVLECKKTFKECKENCIKPKEESEEK